MGAAFIPSTFGDLDGQASKAQLPAEAVTTDDTQTLTAAKTIQPTGTTSADIPLVLSTPVSSTAPILQFRTNDNGSGANFVEHWRHGATGSGPIYGKFFYIDGTDNLVTVGSIISSGAVSDVNGNVVFANPTNLPAGGMMGIYADLYGPCWTIRLANVGALAGYFEVLIDNFGNAQMWRTATSSGGKIEFGHVALINGDTEWTSADGSNASIPASDGSNLYRTGAAQLKTDATLTVLGDLYCGNSANPDSSLRFQGSNYGQILVGSGTVANLQMSVTDGTSIINSVGGVYLRGPLCRIQNTAQTKDYFLSDGTYDYLPLPMLCGVTYAPGSVGAFLEVTSPNGSQPPAAFYSNDGSVVFAVSQTGVAIGGGATVKKKISATATLDFGSISAGAAAELTIAVTGATTGGSVQLGPPSTLETGLIACAFVSTADTVTVRLMNTTGSPVDPAAATWRATVENY